jgi:hypothetical protein
LTETKNKVLRITVEPCQRGRISSSWGSHEQDMNSIFRQVEVEFVYVRVALVLLRPRHLVCPLKSFVKNYRLDW